MSDELYFWDTPRSAEVDEFEDVELVEPEPEAAVYSIELVEMDNPPLRGFDIKRTTGDLVECWTGERFEDGPHDLVTFTEDDLTPATRSLVAFLQFVNGADNLTFTINNKEQ